MTGFSMPTKQPEKKRRCKPKAIKDIDLDSQSASWAWLSNTIVERPPATLRNEFDWGCKMWLCFDVETHDLAPSRHDRGWKDGEFGHHCLKVDFSIVRALRAVQVGWTFGRIDQAEPPKTKKYLIKPVNFEVTDAVSKIHNITHSQASEFGHDLSNVLQELLQDVFAVTGAGGRICAHQIEFDAAVVDAEIQRAQIDMDSHEHWRSAVYDGFCTMNPSITEWCCKKYRQGRDTYGQGNIDPHMACSLPAVAWTLLEPCEELQAQIHDAGNDSRLGWLIVREYHRRMLQNGDDST